MLTVLEQMPGIIVWEDVSKVLSLTCKLKQVHAHA